jgi:hypothetical protein
MEPVEGLGDHIQLHKRILENNFLKHAFAAYLDLENTHRLPKFESEAEVLHTAAFNFINSPAPEGLLIELQPQWAVGLSAQSSYPTAAIIETFLSRGRVKEFESLIQAKGLMIENERGKHLANEGENFLTALAETGASSDEVTFEHIWDVKKRVIFDSQT